MSVQCLEQDKMEGDREASEEKGFSREERDEILACFARDGFVVLPKLLPESLRAKVEQAIDDQVSLSGEHASEALKLDNCVDVDESFRSLMTWKPALQLVYDLLGPSFQLNQSNAIYRPKSEGALDFQNGAVWHADGPRPSFPSIQGQTALYYVKFGYFLTDLQHENGGSLEVVRGSHRRRELDGLGADFRIEDHAEDHVTCHVKAGEVVMFHQALWHAAQHNQSEKVRKNCYFSYSPTWMRPFDRSGVSSEEAAELDPVAAFLMGAPRSTQEYWIPREHTMEVMKAYA